MIQNNILFTMDVRSMHKHKNVAYFKIVWLIQTISFDYTILNSLS